MPQPSALSAEQQRSDARRTQILTAAADCFRRHGFHGASIAQISKAAGMSAGHIYHYFANKEAIIAAIVAQDVARALTLTAELRAARDVKDAMVAGVAQAVTDHLDPDVAALRLEIVAEAARSPGIAEIVRAADARIREGVVETIRGVLAATGEPDGKAAAAAATEVIFAMFEGLLIRAVRNPGLDQKWVAQVAQRVVERVLTPPAEVRRKPG